MKNPRWTRRPFKGWTEDDAATVAGLLIWAAVIGAIVWLHGCYLEHEPQPCDGSLAASEKGSVVASFKPGSPKDPQDAGPVEAVRDDQQEFCEGPYVGCIAPGSPLSSTWKPR